MFALEMSMERVDACCVLPFGLPLLFVAKLTFVVTIVDRRDMNLKTLIIELPDHLTPSNFNVFIFGGKFNSSAIVVMHMLFDKMSSLAIESGFCAKIERTTETSSSQSLKQNDLICFNELIMLLTLRYLVPVNEIELSD